MALGELGERAEKCRKNKRKISLEKFETHGLKTGF